MQPIAVLIAGIFALAGCTAKPAASPYYVTIPDDGTATMGKEVDRYFGQCPVHGRLTNSLRRFDRIDAATYAHNKKYHSDGMDTTWAKVFKED